MLPTAVSLSSLTVPLARDAGPASSEVGGGGGASFANVVDHMLGSAVQGDQRAGAAVRELASGQNHNLHGVLLQVAQADLSFRLILEIRNRLTNAYEEIMKMQV